MQAAQFGFQLCGGKAGYHVGVIQPNLSGNAVCIGAAVACQQDHIQPKGFQCVKGGFAGGLYGIGNADQTGCVAVERKVKRGNAVSGQLLASLLQIGGQLALGGNKLCAAACHHLAGHFAGQALAVQNGNVLNGAQLDVLRSGFAHHGVGQRVLALAFQPGSHAKQELGGHAAGAHNGDHFRLAVGDCSGFIQHGGVQGTDGLQAGGCFEHDAVLGTHAGTGHDGSRSCQRQHTGAADSQHADGAGQRKSKALPQQQPDDEHHAGNADNGGHKHAAYLIGQGTQRHLGSGSGLHGM